MGTEQIRLYDQSTQYCCPERDSADVVLCVSLEDCRAEPDIWVQGSGLRVRHPEKSALPHPEKMMAEWQSRRPYSTAVM